MSEPGAKRKAPVFFQSDSTRLSIIFSYWVVLLLAVPLWWSATSIERLSLPRTRVSIQTDQAQQLRFPINILLEDAGVIENPERLALDLYGRLSSKALLDSATWKGLDLRVTTQRTEIKSEPVYEVTFSKSVPSHQVVGRKLVFRVDDSRLKELPVELGDILCELLTPRTHDQRVVQYANRYRLSFSLLNERINKATGMRGWAAQKFIETHISPFLEQLSVLHNFTIESQVQFYAPLTFEPKKLNGTITRYSLLGEDELKMFVNSAEWTLSSAVSDDTVLHFLLFVPTPEREGLLVLTKDGKPSPTNSFIIPQWGGVIVFDQQANGSANKLFTVFRTQLLSLLGVPELPPNVESDPDGPPLSDWQLDALLRRRSRENIRRTVEALGSIVKLVDQLTNMPVRQDVRGDVTESLNALDNVAKVVASSPQLALQHSSRALTLSSRAFFNPGMVGLLYFPAEHKYAVYTPLFAPVAVPLILALLREIKAWQKRKKAGKEKEE